MKTLLHFFYVFCFIVSVGCNSMHNIVASAENRFIVQREKSVLMSSSKAQTLIKQCSRPSPSKVSGTWEPSTAEIQEMESQFAEIEKMKSEFWSGGRIENVEEYYMQYVGVIANGKKVIYINAFDRQREDVNWKEVPIIGCDGGKSFWGVLYDPETKDFFDLAINGGR